MQFLALFMQCFYRRKDFIWSLVDHSAYYCNVNDLLLIIYKNSACLIVFLLICAGPEFVFQRSTFPVLPLHQIQVYIRQNCSINRISLSNEVVEADTINIFDSMNTGLIRMYFLIFFSFNADLTRTGGLPICVWMFDRRDLGIEPVRTENSLHFGFWLVQGRKPGLLTRWQLWANVELGLNE